MPEIGYASSENHPGPSIYGLFSTKATILFAATAKDFRPTHVDAAFVATGCITREDVCGAEQCNS